MFFVETGKFPSLIVKNDFSSSRSLLDLQKSNKKNKFLLHLVFPQWLVQRLIKRYLYH